MITRQVGNRKLSSTVEAQILIPPEQKFIFQGRVEVFLVDFSMTGDDAGQA